MEDEHIKGKNKNELLEKLNPSAPPCSPAYGQISAAITVRCTEDLEKAISQLRRKITFLDWALVSAAVVGAIATGLIAYKTFIP